jgi:hypothetical protein
MHIPVQLDHRWVQWFLIIREVLGRAAVIQTGRKHGWFSDLCHGLVPKMSREVEISEAAIAVRLRVAGGANKLLTLGLGSSLSHRVPRHTHKRKACIRGRRLVLWHEALKQSETCKVCLVGWLFPAHTALEMFVTIATD